MSTDLTTPISYGTSATSQRVDSIEINLPENNFIIRIGDYDTNGVLVSSDRHTFDIWDGNSDLNIPVNIATEAKDLHRAVTTAAKNAGWIQPGTTTDDLV